MNSLVQSFRGPWPQLALPELWPSVRKRLQRHRKAVAVIGSVLLHLLCLLALWPTGQKGLSSGGSGGSEVGAGTGEAYAAIDLDLDLMPPMPAKIPAVKTPDEQTTQALDPPQEAIRPKTDMAAVATDAAKSADTATTASSPTADAAASAHPAAAAVGGAGPGGATAGTGDDLWQAIAPCWNRIAGSDALPVTLKITFGATGGLSKPPQIVRDETAPITPQSLRSEAQAIAALAQCGGYPMAATRQDVEVHFPRPAT